MFPKKKRIVNKELLKEYHQKKCIVCGRFPAEPHHVTTVGAGGDDVETNLAALCRKHHTMIHSLGNKSFGWKYPKFKEWLVRMRRFDILEAYEYES